MFCGAETLTNPRCKFATGQLAERLARLVLDFGTALPFVFGNGTKIPGRADRRRRALASRPVDAGRTGSLERVRCDQVTGLSGATA